MRKCWVAGSVALLFLLSAGCFPRFPARYSETEELTVPLAVGGTLRVVTQNGAIEVRPGDVKEVQVTAVKKVRSRTEEEARQFCEETKVETETEASGATVKVVLPENYQGRANISVSIEAIVPRKCSLNLTTSNGRIEARGVEGNVEMRASNGEVVGEDVGGNVSAETSNGGIRVERVSGWAEAHSSNGRVTVREAGGDIRCGTSNGSILLYNVIGSAEATSSNGSITCELPGGASAVVSGNTSNGRVECDFPLAMTRTSVSGKIGDGKHSIVLRTTNGSISLKRLD